METITIGYFATSASVIAFGSQFIYIIRAKTIDGISIHRSMMDVVSLILWTAYAARLEDIPLLIATSCELFTSIGILILVLSHNRHKTGQIIALDNNSTLETEKTEQIQPIEIVTIIDRRNSI